MNQNTNFQTIRKILKLNYVVLLVICFVFIYFSKTLTLQNSIDLFMNFKQLRETLDFKSRLNIKIYMSTHRSIYGFIDFVIKK